MKKNQISKIIPRSHITQGAFSFLQLNIIFFILRNLQPKSDIFTDLSFSFFITLAIWIIIAYSKQKINIKKILKILQTSLLTFLIFSSLILQTDRSRTNFTLSWVQKNYIAMIDGKYEISINNPEALNKYAIQERLSENKKRGFFKIEGEKVSLSIFGRLALKTSEILAELFNLEGWHEGTQNSLETKK